MNPQNRLLPVIDPPPGGWSRLRSRRDSRASRAPSEWPLVVGGACALLSLALVMNRGDVIRMQLNGSRLMGERSQETGLRMLDGSRVTSLPSDDPNVRLYWVESSVPPRATHE